MAAAPDIEAGTRYRAVSTSRARYLATRSRCHFNQFRPNRDSAISSALIVNGALIHSYVRNRKKVEGYNSNWRSIAERAMHLFKNPRTP